MERYEATARIGEGTYGVVYKARDKLSGEQLALKRIWLEASDETGIPSTALREVSLLQQLKHPNVVQLLDVIHSDRRLTLVFEYVPQDLKKCLLKAPTGLEPFVVKSLLFQLLQGIAYCHRHRILHRDLKPQNLLIDNNGFLKIADFGLARPFGITPRLYTHEVVTLWYRPPDILAGSNTYSVSVDMWSIGCIFAEMVSGQPLFQGTSDDDQLQKIFAALGTPSAVEAERMSGRVDLTQFPKQEAQPLDKLCPKLDAVGLDLLGQMLRLDPDVRVGAQASLAHPFFKDLKLKRVR